MIRTVPQDRVSELLVMVSRGGPFAEAIFMAFNTAARAGFKDLEDTDKIGEEKVDGGVKDERKEAGATTGGTSGTKEQVDDQGMGEGAGEDGVEAGVAEGVEGDEGAEGLADVGGAAEGVEALAVTEGASIFGGPSGA